MIDFKDRQPTAPGRRKLSFDDGSTKFVTVEMADNPNEEGTLLNRAVLMALQGFHSVDTEFLADGSVRETNEYGDVLTTTFPAGMICLETFTSADGLRIIQKKTFEENGNIREVILDGSNRIA